MWWRCPDGLDSQSGNLNRCRRQTRSSQTYYSVWLVGVDSKPSRFWWLWSHRLSWLWCRGHHSFAVSRARWSGCGLRSWPSLWSSTTLRWKHPFQPANHHWSQLRHAPEFFQSYGRSSPTTISYAPPSLLPSDTTHTVHQALRLLYALSVTSLP